MLQLIRRHLPVAITAVVVSSVFAVGPNLANAAVSTVNADKVDGKDAVGAGATVANRAGKLVATNGSGLLPDNIIASAPDAAKLGGMPPGTYRVTGHGQRGSFVNINGCGSGEITSYAVQLGRKTRIFAAASTTYGRSNPGPERPTMRIQLLDATNAIVAQTGRVTVDATSGNPSLSVAGVLLTDAGAPYEADRGSYTLRLWGDNFGACTGFGQYQQPELSHVELAAGD
jgi:hypothetical protein